MLRKRKVIERLRGLALFSSCSDQELATVASLVRPVRVREGEVVAREDGTGKRCFIIASGQASVSRQGRRLDAIGAGDTWGVGSEPGEPRSTATVTADTEMELFVLDALAFGWLLDVAPRVREQKTRFTSNGSNPKPSKRTKSLRG